MSITSLSFTFVNTYAAQSAKPAGAAERQAPAQTEVKHCDEQRPASRPNRLVEAMMSALRELGFGSQAAAAPSAPAVAEAPAAAGTPATAAEAVSVGDEAAAVAVVADSTAQTDTVAEASEASAEPAQSVESAVHQFAHELFRALRQVGRGESSSEQGSSRIDGDGGHRHHHGHHGWRREGYGDMAQRLDALSQTFAAPAAVAAAVDAESNPLVSSSVSITLTVQDGQADAPAGAVTTTTPMASTAVSEEAVEPADATDATVAIAAPSVAQDTAKNPLLEACSKLFSALTPQAAGMPQADMADKLRTFLQTLAQAMRPETMSSIQAPQVGGLVNVTA